MIKIFALMPVFGRLERENLSKTEEQPKRKKKEKYNSHTNCDWALHTCFHNLSTKYFIAQPEIFTVRKLNTLSYKIYTENVVNLFNLNKIAIFTRIKFFTPLNYNNCLEKLQPL